MWLCCDFEVHLYAVRTVTKKSGLAMCRHSANAAVTRWVVTLALVVLLYLVSVKKLGILQGLREVREKQVP